MYYESLKHSGEIPIIGVNTYTNPSADEFQVRPDLVIRSSNQEKQRQISNLRAFQSAWREPGETALSNLRKAVQKGENTFASLMDAAKYTSLGQITEVLFKVGGEYRRSM